MINPKIINQQGIEVRLDKIKDLETVLDGAKNEVERILAKDSIIRFQASLLFADYLQTRSEMLSESDSKLEIQISADASNAPTTLHVFEAYIFLDCIIKVLLT